MKQLSSGAIANAWGHQNNAMIAGLLGFTKRSGRVVSSEYVDRRGKRVAIKSARNRSTAFFMLKSVLRRVDYILCVYVKPDGACEMTVIEKQKWMRAASPAPPINNGRPTDRGTMMPRSTLNIVGKKAVMKLAS